jgi:hypothetical protein
MRVGGRGGVVVAVAASFAACGGGGGGGVPLDAFAAESDKVACARALVCGHVLERAQCPTSFSGRTPYLLTLVDAVQRGTVTYHPEHARACLDGHPDECVDSQRSPPDCDRTFEGNLPPGAACLLEEECAGDGGCIKPDVLCSTMTCCPGTCVAGQRNVAIGDACAERRYEKACVAGAFCGNGICVAQLPVGSSCANLDACVPPAICAVGTTGICFLPRDEGLGCDPMDPQSCRLRNNHCDSTLRVCRAGLPVGAACPNFECVFSASCVDGVCVARPTIGQACDPAGGPSCLGTLQCDSGTCVPGRTTACAAPP